MGDSCQPVTVSNAPGSYSEGRSGAGPGVPFPKDTEAMLAKRRLGPQGFNINVFLDQKVSPPHPQ